MFSNKVIVLTGGTGSFGRQILHFFLSTSVQEVRIFSRDEKKQDQIRSEFPDRRVKTHIGDVRNYDSVEGALKHVDFVFHAAALKQVPSCEFYPMEAVRTNVLGAENVLRAAIHQKVRRVVLLSTDKAVYPINAMGQTKALMEKVMLARARTMTNGETVLCATRYGNVMTSRGSVIPLFIDQILKGGPITITDPTMTRFMMSLEESANLVLHAFEHGRQGDIFVQKTSAATIGDLVAALKDIFRSECDVKVIGIRHGEKQFESLVSKEEMVRAEDRGAFFRIPADDRDLNYGNYVSEGMPTQSTLSDYNSHSTERLSVAQIKSRLVQLPYVQAVMRGDTPRAE